MPHLGSGGSSANRNVKESKEAKEKIKKEKEEHERRRKAEEEKRPRGLRAESLAKLLGKGALRPPTGTPKPPDFNSLRGVKPAGAASLTDLEACEPPKLQKENAPESSEPHWHQEGAVAFLHDGKAWGRAAGQGWAWLEKNDGHWWLRTFTGGKAEPPPLVWHQDHWWWQNNGVWFLVHDGEPWGYQYFNDLKKEGLVHPGSETRIIYSEGGDKAAVVTPGQGAVVIDLKTGQELKSFTEEQLPHRKQPKIPETYAFPRN